MNFGRFRLKIRRLFFGFSFDSKNLFLLILKSNILYKPRTLSQCTFQISKIEMGITLNIAYFLYKDKYIDRNIDRNWKINHNNNNGGDGDPISRNKLTRGFLTETQFNSRRSCTTRSLISGLSQGKGLKSV